VLQARSRVRNPMKSLNIFFISIYIILPAALGPGVHSASNRNEYWKQKKDSFLGVECGRRVMPTSSTSSSSSCCDDYDNNNTDNDIIVS
jgi:hypothetical protein